MANGGLLHAGVKPKVNVSGEPRTLALGVTSLLILRVYLNPVIDFVGHRYSDRLGGSYRERLVNFGLGILLQTGS